MARNTFQALKEPGRSGDVCSLSEVVPIESDHSSREFEMGMSEFYGGRKTMKPDEERIDEVRQGTGEIFHFLNEKDGRAVAAMRKRLTTDLSLMERGRSPSLRYQLQEKNEKQVYDRKRGDAVN